MKNLLSTLFFSLLSISAFSQGILLSAGDHFPDIPIKNIQNAAVKSFSLSGNRGHKIYIINFWGTWCSPCIPEMEQLSRLQNANVGKIQVIAVSDDSPARLKTFLQKKPSRIWLASDSTFLLYSMFGFASVGNCAIVDGNRKIIAVVKTESVNQQMINKLIKGLNIASDARVNEKKMNNGDDLFGVDSTLNESFTVRSYMQGQRGMTKRYLNGFYEDRRITYVNSTVDRMFTDAWQISSAKKVFYEFDQKLLFDYDNKSHLYCLDLLVKPEQKDSLYSIFQQKLLQVFPVKARIEYRSIPVYILTVAKNKQFSAPSSTVKKMSYSFSGKGFDGQGFTLTAFADLYLSNEMENPVIDETGLSGLFDIKTSVEIRNKEGIIKMAQALGLEMTPAERKVKVLVLSR